MRIIHSSQTNVVRIVYYIDAERRQVMGPSVMEPYVSYQGGLSAHLPLTPESAKRHLRGRT